MERADIAVVFPPSMRAAWQSRKSRRRIGTPTDHRRWLLSDRVRWSPIRADLYRALAERAGARVRGVPTFAVRPDDVAASVPDNHVGLVPLTGAGPVTQWTGFSELAARIAGPVVFYGGPGEERAVAALAGDSMQCVGQPLDSFAATLSRCRVLVTNDSGLAHFGRAVGVPVVTIFGSTIPGWTGAPGADPIQGPALPCRPCYSRACRTRDHACFEIEVDRVLDAVMRHG